jgi:hypothetical protein
VATIRRKIGDFKAIAIPPLLWKPMAFIGDAQVQNRHGPWSETINPPRG